MRNLFMEINEDGTLHRSRKTRFKFKNNFELTIKQLLNSTFV